MNHFLFLIKPDAFKRKLVGQILSTIEIDFEICSVRMHGDIAGKLYAHYAEHVDKEYWSRLAGFMQSGPVMSVIVWGSIEKGRELALRVREQAEGEERNLIHCSSSQADALRETFIWSQP